MSPCRPDYIFTLSRGAVRFGPLGPTPFRDSRCTLPIDLYIVSQSPHEGGVILKKTSCPIADMAEETTAQPSVVAVIHNQIDKSPVCTPVTTSNIECHLLL